MAASGRFVNIITPGQGEQPLESVTLGSRFYVPDAAARERVEKYARADELLDPERHKDIHLKKHPGGWMERQDTQQFWIGLDFPGMLGRLMRHYSIGKDFRVSAKLRGALPSGQELDDLQAEAQGHVDRISKASRLPGLLRQMAEAAVTHGDAVLRIDVVDMENPETGRTEPTARARFVKPGHYFPQLSPFDGAEVEGVELAWVFPLPEDMLTKARMAANAPGGTDVVGGPATADGLSVSGQQMVLREVHTPGRVEYKLNTWNGKKLGVALNVQEAFPDLRDSDTGIDEIPVLHLGNAVRGGEHFGSSELIRVERIILALENRLSQEDEVLEKHARPKLVVGPGVLGDDSRASLKDFDVIEIDPDVMEKAVKPEYLTWDMQVAGITHEIEKLEEYLFITTETSPASFGLERDGSQVESARALRFKSHRTVNKVHDLRESMAEMLDDFFRIAQKLELSKRSDGQGYRRANVAVEFGDPILEDKEQEVQDYVSRKGVGLVSTRTALKDLDELTDEEAQREVENILQDQVNESAASAPTRSLELGPEAGPPAGGGVQPLNPRREDEV